MGFTTNWRRLIDWVGRHNDKNLVGGRWLHDHVPSSPVLSGLDEETAFFIIVQEVEGVIPHDTRIEFVELAIDHVLEQVRSQFQFP